MSRSGTPTRTNAVRSRKMITITLSPDTIDRLGAIARARGQTKSGAVEQLIWLARLPKQVSPYPTGPEPGRPRGDKI